MKAVFEVTPCQTRIEKGFRPPELMTSGTTEQHNLTPCIPR